MNDEIFEAPKQNKIIEYLTKYGWMIILFSYWILFKGKENMIVDKATIYSLSALGSFGVMFLAWEYWKHKTPKLVYNYGFTTTRGECFPAGNYDVFTAGDIRAAGFDISGNTIPGNSEGTLIVPRWAWTFVGPNPVLNVVMNEADFYELSPEIQDCIVMHKLKPPFKIGWVNESELYSKQTGLEVELPDGKTKEKDPTPAFMARELREAYRTNDMLRKIAHLKFTEVENASQFVSNIDRKIVRKKTFMDSLTGKGEEQDAG